MFEVWAKQYMVGTGLWRECIVGAHETRDLAEADRDRLKQIGWLVEVRELIASEKLCTSPDSFAVV